MDVEPHLIHRLFYPQVPAVLSASFRARTSAMPVVSYASVSDSPPLVAVGCNPEAFTCKLVVKSRAFSLSLLGQAQTGKVGRLAEVRGRDVRDKLAAVGLAHTKGTKTSAPVIEASEATLECRVRKLVTTGDHLLIIGRVLAARASSAFSEFWDFTRYSPILYAGWKGGMTTYPGASRRT